MKKLLIGLLVLGNISAFSSEIQIEPGQKIAIVITGSKKCAEDEYVKTQILENTLEASCAAKICVRDKKVSESLFSIPVKVAFNVYVEKGNKREYLERFKGTWEEVREYRKHLLDKNICQATSGTFSLPHR